MHFETGHLYHIYNQDNNREKIFFSREKVTIEGLTKQVLDEVKPSMVSLNDSIGIMLQSYMRAIN